MEIAMCPILYLLCGKVGSGKSSFAKKLESQEILRFSNDEIALAKIQTFRNPQDDYRVTSEPILRRAEEEARKETLELALAALRDKRSVVLDDGFWSKAARDHYRQLAAEVGAKVVLYYLPIELEKQWRRLEKRNSGDLRDVHYISFEEMQYLNKFFEPPNNENEVIIDE